MTLLLFFVIKTYYLNQRICITVTTAKILFLTFEWTRAIRKQVLDF
jgi:hypothetical protein